MVVTDLSKNYHMCPYNVLKYFIDSYLVDGLVFTVNKSFVVFLPCNNSWNFLDFVLILRLIKIGLWSSIFCSRTSDSLLTVKHFVWFSFVELNELSVSGLEGLISGKYYWMINFALEAFIMVWSSSSPFSYLILLILERRLLPPNRPFSLLII